MSNALLTRKAGRSAVWQILGGGWQTIVRLGASIFLARALKPSDFGLFGMALLFRDFLVHIGALGMGTGIIVKKEVTKEDLNTCFWSMAAIRFFLFLVAFLGAPVAALLFKEPRIVPIIQVISFCFLIQILGIIPNILLVKELRFGILNVVNAIAVLLESSLAVFLALTTNLAFWSLVIAMLVSTIFTNLSIFVSVKWFPEFKFSKDSFRYLFRFGIHGLGFSITNYLRQNLDYLLVGRLLGAYQLGLYEFAYRIPHLVFERISRPVGGVVFPALAKVQNDNEKVFIGYIKAVKFVCLITFPMLFGLAAIADILVPILWGDQWLPIIKPLQILCLCAALSCIFQPLGSVFCCKNRPDIPFKLSVLILIFTVISVVPLGYFYGLVGVAIGMLFSVLPSFIVLYFAFHFMLKINAFKLFKELHPIFLASLFCAFSAHLSKELFIMLHLDIKVVLVLSIFSGVLAYLLFLFLLFPSLVKEVFKNVELIFGKQLRLNCHKIL